MDLTEWLAAEFQLKDHPPGRPRVTLTFAQSMDGSISARRSAPLNLSGPESLRLTHQLRAMHDAILVGIGTVLADNPRLAVRLVPGQNPQPVILDSQLRFPLDANLLQSAGSQDSPTPLIAATSRADPKKASVLQERGARLLRFSPAPDGRVPLPSLLDCLANFGIRRLMVEGGARVITSFLAAQLVDYVVLTITPLFVGGLHPVEGRLVRDTGDYPKLQELSAVRMGEDLVVWGKLE